MGKIFVQALHGRLCMNGQQAHNTLLNIVSHQEKSKLKHKDTTSHPLE